MFQTIRLSSRVSVQGELVELLPNGEVIVRDGRHTYRGRPVAPTATPDARVALRPAPVPPAAV
jgi:hypothetical protein